MFKRAPILFLLSLVSMFAQNATPPKTFIVDDLPNDAIEARPDVFRRIEHGKTMIYIRTPLGVTRAEQTEEMRHILEDGPPMGIRVRETATEYLFERDTPFGSPKWSKKKNSDVKLDKLSSEEIESIEYHRKLLKNLVTPVLAPPAAAAKKKQ